jgi:hypothetical protein
MPRAIFQTIAALLLVASLGAADAARTISFVLESGSRTRDKTRSR